MGRSPKEHRLPLPKIKSPSHRFSKVLEHINRPNFRRLKSVPQEFSVYQKALISIYKEEEDPSTGTVESAYLIYSVPAARAVMEGLLISEESSESIAAIIKTTSTCVEVYSELFFDVKVFSNRLIKIAYIRALPTETTTEKFHKQMVSWGYYLGASYIAWKIGARGSIIEKSPEESVTEILTDASWRSKEHFLSDITDAPAKEARSWIPQVLKSAEVIKNMGNSKPVSDTIKDIAFDLQGKDYTIPVDEIEDLKS